MALAASLPRGCRDDNTAILSGVIDRYAALCCPVLGVFGETYHWNIMQVEHATDVVFRSAATLQPLYEREAVLSVKAEGHLPRSQDHTATRPGDRFPGLHPHREPAHRVLCAELCACRASRPRPTTCPFQAPPQRAAPAKGGVEHRDRHRPGTCSAAIAATWSISRRWKNVCGDVTGKINQETQRRSDAGLLAAL